MSRANPLVSVIVPSYNSARTLQACLQSVADQTYAPLELIVVDDGSTDDTAQIARACGATVVSIPVNSGSAVARNVGAQNAKGEIFFYLDSDLGLDSRGVEVAVAMLRENPRIGAICGAYDPEPLLPPSLAARYRLCEQYVWFNEIKIGPIPGLYTALFGIRAEVFREIGLFQAGLSYTEDMDYGFRILQRYEIWVTTAIHGRHDHDATLRMVLSKVFHRTYDGMQLWMRYRSLPGGAATAARATAAVTMFAALLALPLPWLLGPLAALVSPLLLVTTVALDTKMYRHAFASGGLWFGLFFSVMRLLVTATTGVAAAAGVLLYLLSRRPDERRPAVAADSASTGAPTAVHTHRSGS
ncbi:glycosyltransferase family 2 protein [Rhizomonospora bruguierae]|uniref:glycosyltransferase family 2 protein n=1 Tax=Rhizomonospora bruguierae TaxID=1581705 RepID=UPI001BCCCFF2|nr:glycosyltransferase family A protein [Micromonospora sp. NBRC 107566]